MSESIKFVVFAFLLFIIAREYKKVGYKMNANMKFGVFISSIFFIGITIADLFTGSTSRWGSSRPPIGWNAYVRELPTLLLWCLSIWIVTVKVFNVWTKHIDTQNEIEAEEARKRLAEKEAEKQELNN